MSARDWTDLALTAKIEAIHRRSKEVYGAPNIHAELADDYGIRVGRKLRVEMSPLPTRLNRWDAGSGRQNVCAD